MITFLQAGRFFAALAVVFHHTGISLGAFVGTLPALVDRVVHFGYLGVDFFFVLSGFIIHYSIGRAPRPALQFARDRLLRIMLPYWPVGVMLALTYTLLPSLSQGDRVWGWIATLTLFPAEAKPALSVAWTLQHELVFYLVYALLFFTGNLVGGMVMWTAAIIAAQFIVLPDVHLLQTVFAMINIEFVAGLLAAAIVMQGRHVSGVLSLALSIGFLLAFILLGAERNQSVLVGLAIASLLPWIFELERRGKFTVPGWLIFGGAASYAIYLVHNPFLSLLSRGLARVDMGWPLAMLLSVVLSVGVGGVYYALWERPIMRQVKPRDRRK